MLPLPGQPTLITLPYKQHAFNQPDALARPCLWLDLFGPNGHVRAQGIIDSGADLSCLPLGYAALLGYDLQNLVEVQGLQVQGRVTFYQSAVPVRALMPGDVPGQAFELRPNFIENADMILWGRLDFFRAWAVAFNEVAQTFTLLRAG